MKQEKDRDIPRVNSSGIPYKKAYFPPILKHQAHLRDITLGGSPGTGDTGNQFVQQSFTESAPFSRELDSRDTVGKGDLFENDLFGG